jgi:hypothetical protein
MNIRRRFSYYYIIIFIICIFFIITILSIKIVKADVNLSPIKVAINSGDNYKTIVGPNEELLNGYTWIINNTGYFFNTSIININDIKNGNLTTENYSVHIIDGVSDEFFDCYRNPRKTEDD